MTAFTRFLGEKAERYIELRHSLGYSFSKQAGTLRVQQTSWHVAGFRPLR
ncbi:hypothetical protein NKJ06_35265 [Mesorhizobium sp. M0293]